MRILFLLTNFPGFGGIEKVTECLAGHLASAGHDVQILTYGSTAPEAGSNFNITRLPDEADYSSVRNVDFLRDFLKRSNPDRIILQDSYAPIEHIFDEIDYPWTQKLIVVEHNTPLYALKTVNSYFYTRKGTSYLAYRILKFPASIAKAYLQSRLRHRKMLRHAWKYIILSESYRSELGFICGGLPQDKIFAINNPLTISEEGIGKYAVSKKKQILFVGRETGQKGLEFLKETWKKFSVGHKDWELVIVGAGEFNEFKTIEGVRIERPTDKIEEYYKEASILAMTSIYEGWPLVLNEAMSRGCIPVAFNSFSSATDIISDGANGFIVKPFDIDRYVEVVSTLTSSVQLRNEMSGKAVDSINRFSLKNIGIQWEEILA